MVKSYLSFHVEDISQYKEINVSIFFSSN